MKIPKALDDVLDAVLAHKPKPRTKTPARKRSTKRAQKTSRKILKPAAVQRPQVPNALKLGVYYPDYGGAFHGLVRGDEGKPDYWVFSAVKNQNASGTFDENAEYAKNLKIGQYHDYNMPNRREQQLQMANAAPGQFEQDWYWSCEQCADHPDYAWCQDFGYCSQLSWRKVNRYRGCPVRRLKFKFPRVGGARTARLQQRCD